MPEPARIRVFISSPSDVMKERDIAEHVIARLDGIWKAHVRFESIRWERAHYEATKGFQEAIGEMSAFDIVCAILWKRIGHPLAPDRFRRPDGSPYESGTIFEVESALACGGKPAVYLFRKTEPVMFAAESVAEDKVQYDALLDWWNRTVRDGEGYFRRGYQKFSTAQEFEARLLDLLETHLRAAGLIPSGPAWDIATKGSPYPGLVPYEAAYSMVFFGRGLAAAEALRDIRAAAQRDMPALFIVGPSGSGKSSLVRAGLLPSFAGTQIPGVELWRRVLLEPAHEPLNALADRLYRDDALPELAHGPQPDPAAFAALARAAPQLAADSVKWALAQAAEGRREHTGGRLPAVRLLLVLDQLETVLDSADRSAIAALARALVESASTWMIATLRSDRYADLQLDPDFLRLRRGNALFDLPPPGASEIADIVEGPARAAGLVFEERDGRSLAKTIEMDVGGADALPLLQMTLSQLFHARESNTLTCSAYDAMGGLEGAIAAKAEEVFRSASPAAQQTLDAVLRSLVADMDENGQLTIRTPDRAAFAADPASLELVDKMTEARLLVSADTGVRIAHEALLRRWRRALESPALQPEAIRLRRQIGPNFDVWRKTQVDGDLLQAGTALSHASAIAREHPGAFPPQLEDYVNRSAAAAAARAQEERKRAEADARRSRWLTRAALMIAAILAGLSGLIYTYYTRAQQSEEETRHQAAASLYRNALEQQQQGYDEAALAYLAKAGRLDAASRSVATALLMLLGNRYYPSPAMRDLLHGKSVNSARFSPDGTRVVTASADHTAVIWDAHTGRALVKPLEHADVVFGAQFDPEGLRVLTWANDNTAQIWDARSGERIGRPMQHRGWVTSAAFNPDGTLVVTGSFDCTARVWDARTGEPIGPALAHSGWVDSVAFSPDGRSIVTAADSPERPDPQICRPEPGVVAAAGNAAHIWDVASWARIGAPLQHASGVRTAYFSADGRRVVTASNDHTARLWDASSGAPLGEPMRHDARAYTAEFDRKGTRVVTASSDKTARIWDGLSGRPLSAPLRHQREVKSAIFSPDGHTVLTASEDMTVQVWDAETGAPAGAPVRHHGVALSAQYSPDGTMIVSASDDHTARIFDADAGRPRPPSLQHQGPVRSAAFGGQSGRVATASQDGTAALWDARTGKRVGKWLRHKGPVNSVELDGEGRRALTASDDGTARLWDASMGEPVGPVLRHEARVTGAWFSPDGGRALTLTANGYAYVWDLVTGARIGAPLQHVDGIRNAAFSPDGSRVATAPNDHAARLWDAATGQPMGPVLQHEKGVNTVRFSRDGKWILTASDDQTARIWDAVTGAPRGAPFLHQGPVLDAEFSQDGRWIVTASKEGSARVFDVETGALVGAIMRHDGAVHTAFLSPDRRYVLTASADGSARLWEAATGQAFGMLLAHRAGLNGARFAPDARRVVTASDDGTARLWAIPEIEPDQIPLVAQCAEAVARLTLGKLGDLQPLDADARKCGRDGRPAGEAGSDADRILRDLSAGPAAQ